MVHNVDAARFSALRWVTLDGTVHPARWTPMINAEKLLWAASFSALIMGVPVASYPVASVPVAYPVNVCGHRG